MFAFPCVNRYRLGDAESPEDDSDSDTEEATPVAPKRKAASPKASPSPKKPALGKTSSNISYGGGKHFCGKCFALIWAV